MSRIRLYGDTSGYIDIKAPDEAGNAEVVIPEGSFVGQDQLTQELALKAPIDSPDFDGITSADNYDVNLTTVASNTINIDFSGDTGLYTRSINGNVTFTGSNYSTGSLKTIRIVSDGSTRNISFPSEWIFVGLKPTNISANKTGILALACFGESATDCVASWTVQL